MDTPIAALEVRHLTKVIGDGEILSDVSLTLAPGEICAVIGPNGAGKTTLFKAIAGLVFPSSGTVTVFGEPMNADTRDRLLPQFGVTIEVPEFHSGLTARQALETHFDLLVMRGERPIESLLALVGLGGAADTPLSSFSLGMRQRLSLARAVAHRPRILLLDEPTNGLDPGAIASLRGLLAGLVQEGACMLVAGHILSELEQSAHTVAVLESGRLSEKVEISGLLAAGVGGLEAFYRSHVRGGVQ